MRYKIHYRVVLAGFMCVALVSSSLGEEADQSSPFRAHVDMKTFMEHVITPAASIVWGVNAITIDNNGEHESSPKSDADWEQLVSGSAALAEATNALMIPERVLDRDWIKFAQKLADEANTAYQAAEDHDLKSISGVSDRLDGVCYDCHHHYCFE